MSEEHRLSRRGLLTAGAALALPGWSTAAAATGIPGPYRGRVVEVYHPGSVVEGKVRAEAVREMVSRGMRELTAAADDTAAWKRFFSPADVVGVKVSPVGRPKSISQPETLLEVFRGLTLAGVPNRNIMLINRYEEEILACEFDKILPKGVRIGYGAKKFDDVQVSLEEYDPDVYVEMDRVLPRFAGSKDPLHRRSHVCKVITRELTKIVNVSVLKDHASAGITMALKNMSHGSVNNVSRSHAGASGNWCDTFIPKVVSMPVIREKMVLQIGDALIGTYDGGPGTWNPHFRTWEYRSLFFGTDPVAMDRIGWGILDAKRKEQGLPPLEKTGRKGVNPGGHEGFDWRQPQHVLLAAKAGLGEADLAKIAHRRVRLG